MARLLGKLRLSFLTVFLLVFNANAAGTIAGKVTILKGQVFIQRGGQKIQVKKDDTILESDIIESEAGTARITMIDSNLVDVYPRSKVEIAKYIYKPNEDQKEVELKIDFGKIKSTVNQKYDGAKNKFQVKTPSAVAGVRGTVFTAEYDRIKKVSRVVTIEGLVAVSKMLDRERQTPPVFVRPDQVVKVDVEQSKAEQPRDLKPEERDVRQQEDKDLGYQYDPKQELSPEQQPTGAIKEPVKDIKESLVREVKEIREPIKEIAVIEPVKDTAVVKEQIKERRKEFKERLKELKEVRRAKDDEPIKEISVRPPVVNEMPPREPVKQIKETITTAVNNSGKREQLQQQAQERRQKQLEEEQGKKQKQLEEDQTRKQKHLEEEQVKKQKQSEEEQAKKQKHLEEEQAKKQKQSEVAQAKRRAMEEAQKKSELARRLAEIAKRGSMIRPPSGTDTGLTPPNTITPINK